MPNKNNSSGNDPNNYAQLRETYRATLDMWIQLAIMPAATPRDDSSYFLKHEFEYQTGLYVDNGEFKGAMIHAGYAPVDESELNWTFRIKRTSPKRKQYKLTPEHPVWIYDISHISQEQRAQFETLVKNANHQPKKAEEK